MRNLPSSDEFRTMLEILGKKAPEREWVVMTGPKGKENFDHVFQVQIYRDELKSLRKSNKVSQEIYNSISEMINSSDRSNFNLAKAIIQQLQERWR